MQTALAHVSVCEAGSGSFARTSDGGERPPPPSRTRAERELTVNLYLGYF